MHMSYNFLKVLQFAVGLQWLVADFRCFYVFLSVFFPEKAVTDEHFHRAAGLRRKTSGTFLSQLEAEDVTERAAKGAQPPRVHS